MVISEHNQSFSCYVLIIHETIANTSSSVTNFPLLPSSNSTSLPANPLMRTLSPFFTVFTSLPTEETEPQIEEPGPPDPSEDAASKIPPAVCVSSFSGTTSRRFPMAESFSGLNPAEQTETTFLLREEEEEEEEATLKDLNFDVTAVCVKLNMVSFWFLSRKMAATAG